MARTQKNKATAKHLGLLKARLAKLKAELIAPKAGAAQTGEGWYCVLSWCMVSLRRLLKPGCRIGVGCLAVLVLLAGCCIGAAGCRVGVAVLVGWLLLVCCVACLPECVGCAIARAVGAGCIGDRLTMNQVSTWQKQDTHG